MYCVARDEPSVAKNVSIMEDCGQVSFIFSDKTGTLTRNEMEFKSMCVGGVLYESMEVEGKQIFDKGLFEKHMTGNTQQEVDIRIQSENGNE